MIGLGRMGANMVRRWQKNSHKCVVCDRSVDTVKQLEGEARLSNPRSMISSKKLAPAEARAIWLMVPAAVVDASLHDLVGKLESGDNVIRWWEFLFIDDIRARKTVAPSESTIVTSGTRRRVWGLERDIAR